MVIIRSAIPENSLLNQLYKNYNYTDSFQGLVTNKQKKLNPEGIAKSFFLSAPTWVSRLFWMRNKIAAFFGLKTSNAKYDLQKILRSFNGEKDQHVGLFRVFDKSENEIILGEDDKHLNFRVSLYLDRSKNDGPKTNLTISTIVVFNNWFGRLYFFIVRPFHRLIVPEMLKGMIRQLENKARSCK
jgi:Protein of unknown function (DUF2867)